MTPVEEHLTSAPANLSINNLKLIILDWVLNIALSLSVSFVGAPELLLLPTIFCFNSTLLFHLSLAYPVNFDQNMESTLVVTSVHFCSLDTFDQKVKKHFDMQKRFIVAYHNILSNL